MAASNGGLPKNWNPIKFLGDEMKIIKHNHKIFSPYNVKFSIKAVAQQDIENPIVLLLDVEGGNLYRHVIDICFEREDVHTLSWTCSFGDSG